MNERTLIERLNLPWPEHETEEVTLPAWVIELCAEAATTLVKKNEELAEVWQQYVDANEARIDAEAQLDEALKALDELASDDEPADVEGLQEKAREAATALKAQAAKLAAVKAYSIEMLHRKDEQFERAERAEAALAEALKVLEVTRSLVSEAAMTGFNCHEGDWAERLYANNGNISAVLDAKEVR